jgi:membrane-bound ClpP family serine protease
MTQTGSFALISFALGAILLIAEILLPTHGILGLLAGLSIITGVGACFVINPMMGFIILLALVIATPLIWTALVKIWPSTPVGRRLVLTEIAGRTSSTNPVGIGQTGLTVSELKPMGECDFDGLRVEAISDQGMILAGTRVKVIALSNHRPVVQTTSGQT